MTTMVVVMQTMGNDDDEGGDFSARKFRFIS
jgi:hypothetical protein